MVPSPRSAPDLPATRGPWARRARWAGGVVVALVIVLVAWTGTERPDPWEGRTEAAAWCRAVDEAFEGPAAGIRSFAHLVRRPDEPAAATVAARLLRTDHAPPQRPAWQSLRGWLRTVLDAGADVHLGPVAAARLLDRERTRC